MSSYSSANGMSLFYRMQTASMPIHPQSHNEGTNGTSSTLANGEKGSCHLNNVHNYAHATAPMQPFWCYIISMYLFRMVGADCQVLNEGSCSI